MTSALVRLKCALFASLCMVAVAAAEPTTIDDIATHLGICAWATNVKFRSGSYSACLLEIVDGKSNAISVSIGAEASDLSKRRIAVLASPGPDGTKLTLIVGGGSYTMPQHDSEKHNIPLPMRSGLPQQVGEGDYVLGGEYKGTIISGHVEDVKHGLGLRIQRVAHLGK